MQSELIYHIATSEQIDAAANADAYRHQSLQSEGFIHCSYAHQLEGVVERYFKGQNDLMVLEIDRSRLAVRVADENATGGTELFPHVYGVIPKDSVVQVLSYSRFREIRNKVFS